MSIKSADEASRLRSPLILTLFVAGQTLYAREAIENLSAIIQELQLEVTVTIIDVLTDPQSAIDHRIYATPALLAKAGDRVALLVGDLTEREKVMRALRAM